MFCFRSVYQTSSLSQQNRCVRSNFRFQKRWRPLVWLSIKSRG